MNLLRNILAVIVGVFIGSIVNMLIIKLGHSIFPFPEGLDPNNLDSISEYISLNPVMHSIPPFLAHAIGTLVGAMICYKIAATNKSKLTYVIGVFFLAGGIYASQLIKAPMLFVICDLTIAYLPMAWLANKLLTKKELSNPTLD